MNPKNEVRFFETVVDVLGYREDSTWIALALQMDLRGYGKTWNGALAELKELISMQLSFAHFKKQPEMIFRNAEPIWFQLFADARRRKIEREINTKKITKKWESEYQTGGISLPPNHVISQINEGFHLSDA
jgi:hypothetical protein